jgi:uncharacterized protein (DUF1330 family)
MPKAYLVVTYRSIKDPEKLAAYAKLSAPAVAASGGRFIARGPAQAAYEQGLKERTVLIEFDDLAAALKHYDSLAYREALAALGDGAVRDMRVIEGV